MITSTSRYAGARVVRVVNTQDGSTRSVIVQRPPRTEIFDFTYYQWIEGDRVDLLARDYFDDETLWYLIAEANPEILVWTDVEVGTVIRIPNG